MTLDEYRREFERQANRSISMPLAGMIVWFAMAIFSVAFTEANLSLILLFAMGSIFPIALVIAKFRGEELLAADNPLAKLMGLCVLMVNLLWALHIPLYIFVPEFIPLSLGVGLGLHWVIYSWIIQHPVGIYHAVLRALSLLAVWFIFPDYRFLAICIAVVLMYLVSTYLMLTRQIRYA